MQIFAEAIRQQLASSARAAIAMEGLPIRCRCSAALAQVLITSGRYQRPLHQARQQQPHQRRVCAVSSAWQRSQLPLPSLGSGPPSRPPGQPHRAVDRPLDRQRRSLAASQAQGNGSSLSVNGQGSPEAGDGSHDDNGSDSNGVGRVSGVAESVRDRLAGLQGSGRRTASSMSARGFGAAGAPAAAQQISEVPAINLSGCVSDPARPRTSFRHPL